MRSETPKEQHAENEQEEEDSDVSDQEADVSGDELTDDDLDDQDILDRCDNDASDSPLLIKNPFFDGSDEDEEKEDGSDEEEVNSDKEADKADASDKDSGSDVSDDSDMDDSDDDGDDDDDEEKSKGFEGEDDLIAVLKSAREKKIRDSPPDIKLKESGTDISFHPDASVLAIANLLGEISIFSVSNEENKALKKVKIHKGGVRCIEYNGDGSRLISGGKDKSIKVLDTETWNLVSLESKLTHPAAIYALAPMEHGCVSGDEDGTVKLWDFRTNKPVLSSKRFDEFVSCFLVEEEKQRIMAASGEGTIQSWDLRMNKAALQSEVYSSELNCLSTVREGTKLVVGSGEGALYIFNEGEYGYHSDQYPGHPDAVNSLISVTDNVVVTGCEDGTIRAVHLFPHRFIGMVGHHDGDMPVEKMDVNGEGDLIASIGHDNRVKFWNISYLEKMDYEKKRKPQIQNKNVGPKKRKLAEAVGRESEHQLPSSGRQNKKDFFSGFKE